MTFETNHQPHPAIDIPRLFADLRITEEHLAMIADLNLPLENRVTSRNPIKTNTAEDALHVLEVPKVNVLGSDARSSVDNQPFGTAVAVGACN